MRMYILPFLSGAPNLAVDKWAPHFIKNYKTTKKKKRTQNLFCILN